MPGKRFIVVADNHGDKQEPSAVKALFAFVKDYKPQIRIHLGDCFDLRWARKGASDEDKRELITEDVNAGIEFIHKFKPTHFLRGNHDERLWDMATYNQNGILKKLAEELIGKIMAALGDIPVLPYDKAKGILRYGNLSMIHGYHSGLSASREAARTFGPGIILQGHNHVIDEVPVEQTRPSVGRCIGSLCLTNMIYNRAQPKTLRQMNGCAYGEFFPNKSHKLEQMRFENGRLDRVQIEEIQY